MGGWLSLLTQIRWQDLVDIALVAFVVYHLILLVRGTRAMHMLMGLGLVFVVLVLSRLLDLLTVNWIINSFLSSFILVVIILFAGDIRKALSSLGRGAILGAGEETPDTLQEVVRAAESLAKTRTGAILVLERSIGLQEYMEVGQPLDAAVSRDLLISIFQPSGPLHDGAAFVRGDRVAAVRCLLPLSSNPSVSARFGTRHRAALGLSEETDAVVVVVSEERGQISVAEGGKLSPDLEPTALRRLLFDLFAVGQRKRRLLWFLERLRA